MDGATNEAGVEQRRGRRGDGWRSRLDVPPRRREYRGHCGERRASHPHLDLPGPPHQRPMHQEGRVAQGVRRLRVGRDAHGPARTQLDRLVGHGVADRIAQRDDEGRVSRSELERRRLHVGGRGRPGADEQFDHRLSRQGRPRPGEQLETVSPWLPADLKPEHGHATIVGDGFDFTGWPPMVVCDGAEDERHTARLRPVDAFHLDRDERVRARSRGDARRQEGGDERDWGGGGRGGGGGRSGLSHGRTARRAGADAAQHVGVSAEAP